MIEWETTIEIPITKALFDEKLQNKSYLNDYIFIFFNGTRLSNRHMQKKETVITHRLLGFYKNHQYPLIRTIAKETETNLPCLSNNCMVLHRKNPEISCIPSVCTKYIHRVIIYQENGVRVSFNKESSVKGIKYIVEYEIEYPENTNYNTILKYERKLMKLVVENNHSISRDSLTLETIFSCIMSKIQMWHCFDADKSFYWAYKWNGVKCKLLITDIVNSDGHNLVRIWPDAQSITTKLCVGLNTDILYNTCILAEMMDDCFVIVEIIASQYSQDIYKTEPMININFLKHLKRTLSSNVYIDGKPLIVQTFSKAKSLESDNILKLDYDKSKYDGFIIVQNDMIIKWKIPTIDVECVSQNEYIIDKYKFEIPHNGIVGQIYEMTCKYVLNCIKKPTTQCSNENDYNLFIKWGIPSINIKCIDTNEYKLNTHKFILQFDGEIGKIYELSRSYVILRQRNDRLTYATDEEYNLFINSINLLYINNNQQ